MTIPWWVWVLASLALLLILLRFARKSSRSRARKELIAAIRSHVPEAQVAEGEDSLDIQLPGAPESTILLQNFYNRMAGFRQGDTASRAEFVQEYVAEFFSSLRQAQGGSALDPVRDRDRVFPRLIPREALQDMPSPAHSRTFAVPELVIGYVLDSEHSMRWLSEDDMTALGLSVDELHRVALDNLRTRFPKALVRGVVEKRGVVRVKTGDGYDAARLLPVPEFLEDGEELVAAIPDRDTLFLAPMPEGRDWRRLRAAALTPAGPTLFGKLLCVTTDRFNIV